MTTINNTVKAIRSDLPAQLNQKSAPGKPLGLYLHIPFCVRKCNYCDFLSFGGVEKEDQKKYFNALIQEIQYYGEVYRNIYYVDTIFIGGGTPSLAEESLIYDLMLAVRNSFTVDPKAEITIESNPKTLTKSKLNTYLDAGVNRISIGAQSLNDSLLNELGRVHTKEDFLKNYFLARECGFRNINIDLMFAVPEQTMQIWTDTLIESVKLAPEHISFYSLQVEEGTHFYNLAQDGSLKEIGDELDREMYHGAAGILQRDGYIQYEISNAAKEGCRCRHNLKYWSMDDYLGCGLGAHSFLNGTRFSNITDLTAYIEAEAGKYDHSRSGQNGPIVVGHDATDRAGSPFVQWRHENTRDENISEYLFTGMRRIDGIDLADFKKRFGVSLDSLHGSVLENGRESGLLEITGGRLRFTAKGIDLSNRVLAEFV